MKCSVWLVTTFFWCFIYQWIGLISGTELPAFRNQTRIPIKIVENNIHCIILLFYAGKFPHESIAFKLSWCECKQLVETLYLITISRVIEYWILMLCYPWMRICKWFILPNPEVKCTFELFSAMFYNYVNDVVDAVFHLQDKENVNSSERQHIYSN